MAKGERMGRKRYLSQWAAFLLAGFAGLAAAALVRLALMEARSPRPNLWPVVALALCLAALGILSVFMLILPYRKLVRMQRLFIHEQLFDEMFRVNVSLSPGEAQLLDHFHYLLNKQDVLELSKKQAEYLALQNQINPHFLYNTLEAIRADALCSGVMGVAQTSEALATFFRYTITEMGDMVTIEDELENVDNYFTIQRYRFGEKLKMRVEMDDEQLGQCKIPKLTLQPIVENAIYHGLENQADGGLVTVSIRATEKSVLILIRDDGVGMDPANVQKINLELAKVDLGYIGGSKKRRGGIALRNVNQRVKLLFGEEYGLQLFSASGVGTEVRIYLPKLAGGRGDAAP